MALHRDIFWIGRQWAVTGAGIQAVDQRLRGVLDIDIARLWDEAHVQSRRAKPGVNEEDFDKAVTVARERFPETPASAPFVAQLPALGVIGLRRRQPADRACDCTCARRARSRASCRNGASGAEQRLRGQIIGRRVIFVCRPGEACACRQRIRT